MRLHRAAAPQHAGREAQGVQQSSRRQYTAVRNSLRSMAGRRAWHRLGNRSLPQEFSHGPPGSQRNLDTGVPRCAPTAPALAPTGVAAVLLHPSCCTNALGFAAIHFDRPRGDSCRAQRPPPAETTLETERRAGDGASHASAAPRHGVDKSPRPPRSHCRRHCQLVLPPAYSSAPNSIPDVPCRIPPQRTTKERGATPRRRNARSTAFSARMR
jgi:hypothetical protein